MSMLSLIDEHKALPIAMNYFSLLKYTGYVKRGTVKRILAYEFLLDFIENAYWYITDEDYSKIITLLRYLFADGDCLMPYPTFCANRIKIGKGGYFGTARLRITENETVDINGNDIGNFDRITEDEELRTMV